MTNDKKELLEEVISDIISEKTPHLGSIKGDSNLISLLEVVLLLKKEVCFEKGFQIRLEAKLLDKFFHEQKTSDYKISNFVRNIFSAVLLVFGFPYYSKISEYVTYGDVYALSGNANLHYGNFKYNYIGFSCLPLISQNVLK